MATFIILMLSQPCPYYGLFVMLTVHEGSEFIACDAIFATVMIVLNGVISLCFFGSFKHYEMSFGNEGTNSALGVLTAMATFILVMPIVTTSTPGPDFIKVQLAFTGIACFALYIASLFSQAVSHRDYYLSKAVKQKTHGNTHADRPSNLKTGLSVVLLLISLAVLVGLAEALSPVIESGVRAAGAPKQKSALPS